MNLALLNLLAVIVSPVAAVLISIWVQDRKEKRKHQLGIFATLMATRYSPLTDESVRALNMIDVVFHKARDVRRLWREYFDMLSNEGLNNPQGWNQRDKKRLELITAMAVAVGYGGSITHLDVDRVYYPVWMGRQVERGEMISAELLRVLQGSSGVTVTPIAANGALTQVLPGERNAPGT